MNDPKSKDCLVELDLSLDPNRNIHPVPETSRSLLNPKEQTDYQNYRVAFLSWLFKEGKDPARAEGYSPYTVYVDSQRSAKFDRWVWEHEDGYTVPPTEEVAQQYMEQTAMREVSNATKGKIQGMLDRYNKWLRHTRGHPEWEFEYSFESSSGRTQPADFLTVDERRQIRQAAMHLGDDDDWRRTTIVWTSLDAGLRPVEVGRAQTYWVDTTNQILRIPMEDSSKNSDNWRTSITERTAKALDEWLDQRETMARYDETERLWLTRRGNPYSSQSLGRMLHTLCDIAEIDTGHRDLSWYAIRHSVGTLMTKQRDLKASKDQLRHKSTKTTMKYDQVPTEDRRDALNRMG